LEVNIEFTPLFSIELAFAAGRGHVQYEREYSHDEINDQASKERAFNIRCAAEDHVARADKIVRSEDSQLEHGRV
jgi:hypothetical protein